MQLMQVLEKVACFTGTQTYIACFLNIVGSGSQRRRWVGYMRRDRSITLGVVGLAVICGFGITGCTGTTAPETVGTLETIPVTAQTQTESSIGTASAAQAVAVFDAPGGVSIGRVEAGTDLSVSEAVEGWLRVELESSGAAWVAENSVVFTPGVRSTK